MSRSTGRDPTSLRTLAPMTRYPIFLLALAVAPIAAQRPLPPLRPQAPVGDTSIFAPLVLPTANESRTGSGAPGVTLLAEPRRLRPRRHARHGGARRCAGEMTLRVHQQLARHAALRLAADGAERVPEGSLNSLIFPQDSRFGARGFEGGYVIDRSSRCVGGAAQPRRLPLDARATTRR